MLNQDKAQNLLIALLAAGLLVMGTGIYLISQQVQMVAMSVKQVQQGMNQQAQAPAPSQQQPVPVVQNAPSPSWQSIGLEDVNLSIELPTNLGIPWIGHEEAQIINGKNILGRGGIDRIAFGGYKVDPSHIITISTYQDHASLVKDFGLDTILTGRGSGSFQKKVVPTETNGSVAVYYASDYCDGVGCSPSDYIEADFGTFMVQFQGFGSNPDDASVMRILKSISVLNMMAG